MRKDFFGRIVFLLVMFLPLVAVVYFDFPHLRPEIVLGSPRALNVGGEADATVVAELPAPAEDAAAPSKKRKGSKGHAVAKLSRPPVETALPSPNAPQSMPTVADVDKFLVDFGDLLRKLPEGRVVLLAPKAMEVNDKREVEARVGYAVPIDVLKKGASREEEAGEGPVRVSVEMAAVLTGPGFAIEPVTPEEQWVAKGFATVWKWNVAAKESGSQELEATLYAIMPSGSAGVRHRVDSYVQTITVSVREETWNDTFGAFGGVVESVGTSLDQLKGILVTLFGAGITAFGWLRLRRRKQRTPSQRARYCRGVLPLSHGLDAPGLPPRA